MTWDQMKVGARICKPGMPDTVRLDIMPFGLFLLIRRSNISDNQVLSIEKGIAQFRVIKVDNHIVFLSRFGMMHWQRSLFHLAEAYSKKVPSPIGKLPVYVVLVDGPTGKVLTRRIESLKPETTRKLVTLMATQDPEDKLLNKAIMERRITNKYTTLQLVALASLHTKIRSS